MFYTVLAYRQFLEEGLGRDSHARRQEGVVVLHLQHTHQRLRGKVVGGVIIILFLVLLFFLVLEECE